VTDRCHPLGEGICVSELVGDHHLARAIDEAPLPRAWLCWCGGRKGGAHGQDDEASPNPRNARLAHGDVHASVRNTLRQCGRINISAHFAEWAKLGLKMGKMYEAKVLAEAGGGSGTVDFSYCQMSITK